MFTNLVPETDTKKLAQVSSQCVILSCTSFSWYQKVAPNRMQLYSVQVPDTSNLYQIIECVSPLCKFPVQET